MAVLTASALAVFLVLATHNGAGLAEEQKGCWWTGCQKSSWAVKGCAQYDLKEEGSKECEDGLEYHCCPKPDSGSGHGQAEPGKKGAAVPTGCWWTGCEKKTWAARGCAQHKLQEKEKKECDDGEGDLFMCCPGPEGEGTATNSSTSAPPAKPTEEPCWWTGCQPDNWAVKGCSQYNRTQQDVRTCDDGKEYHCCPQHEGGKDQGGEGDDGEDEGYDEDVKRTGEECWWTECQPREWSRRGCPATTKQKKTESCGDAGDIFECCGTVTKEKPADSQTEPLSGGSYEDFVKFLLLRGKNFTVEPDRLKCTMLDPDKEGVIQIQNEGIRLCDLCPNFPQQYLEDIFLDRIPTRTASNLAFPECFGHCSEADDCLAFSYDQVTKTCFYFNSTVGLLTRDDNWKTVLMTQPVGLVRSWVYSRHTSIAGSPLRESSRASFPACLEACSAEAQCRFASYSLHERTCRFFSTRESIAYVDINYGWVSAFHIEEVPHGADDDTWRFAEEGDDTLFTQGKTVASGKCRAMANETHSGYYDKTCLHSQSNGCDVVTGCRQCYYPERTGAPENLAICPDSEAVVLETIKKAIRKHMQACVRNEDCIGVGYNAEQQSTFLITTGSYVPKHTTRFTLKYPGKRNGIQRFIQRNDFTLDFDIVKRKSRAPAFYLERDGMTLDSCLDDFQKNTQATRLSYSQRDRKCKLSSSDVKMVYSEAGNVIGAVKKPSLSSPQLHYVKTFGTALPTDKAVRTNENCGKDCERVCTQQCNDEHKSWCAYIMVKVLADKDVCYFYNGDEDLQVSELAVSTLFTKVSAMDFTLESLNKLEDFQASDVYNCFTEDRESTSTLLSRSAVAAPRSEVALRRKRGFFSAIGKAFKKIGKAIVDTVKETVKTVVDTAKGAVKSVGKLVKGDLKGAKDEFLKIPVVHDVKNAVELGGAVITGDWNKAKEKGAELLQSRTLDLVTSVAMPVGGKLIGKGLSTIGKVVKNTGKNAKRGVKDKVKDVNKNDKKLKDKKDKKQDENKKPDEQRGSQCKNKRPKRATATSKRKKPGNDCDDDDDDGKLCNFPRLDNVIDLTARTCNKRKVGSRCDYECEPGYDEVDPKLTCRKEANAILWSPRPRCVLDRCQPGPYPVIALETPQTSSYTTLGPAKHIVAYTVLFDKTRKLPVWSIALHQSSMFQSKSYNDAEDRARAGGWRQYPCTALAGRQASDLDYAGTGWHRGHLTPANVARWSHKATLTSNMYINAAPQDGKTNEGPWKSLEAHTQCFSKRLRTLVATGVCPNNIGYTKGPGSVPVPACFWKMLCYKDENNNEQVVGFFSDNSKVSSQAQLADRRKQVFTPVAQKDLRKYFAGKPSPWVASATSINRGREVQLGGDPTVWFPVSPFACDRISDLNKQEGDAWAAAFAKTAHFLDRGKNPRNNNKKTNKNKKKRTRRAPSEGLYRGCRPGEMKEVLSMLGFFDGSDPDDPDDSGSDDQDAGDGKALVSVQGCNKRIIGYYTSWGKKRIGAQEVKRLTHIVYAFLEVSADGQVSVGSADRKNSENPDEESEKSRRRLESLLKITSRYPHVKVLFAVGGWENSQYFSAIAASPSMRITFISSVVKMIEKYGFDGVDVDWEYPVTGGANEGVPADKQNYVQLMKELRETLDNLANVAGRRDKFLISFAGAAGQWTLDPGFDLPGLLKYADFVNVMTYDYFGAWASKWGAYTGPPAPLYFGMPPRFSGKTNTAWTIKYYTCKTKLPHKINMGVPFYGRYWKNVGESVDGKDGMWRTAAQVGGKFEGGYVPWNTMEDEYLSKPGFEKHFHEKAKAPYAFNAGTKTFLGYENVESLGHKVKFAEDKNVGGLMVWAVDLDGDDLTLLNTVYKASLCSNTNPSAVNHKCNPIDEKRWWTSEDGDDKAGLCGRSAPLYKGYYPVCDPDDPGYSCCGEFGYCGSGEKFCNCRTCTNYGEDPASITKEPIKPTVPVSWYLLNDADGKRGRCGRKIPKIGDKYPTCNPDDDNAHCCSNGGYCGGTAGHCECDGCVNFRKNPRYEFGPKKWWAFEDGKDKSGRCGASAPKVDGKFEAECDPDSKFYCCSASGYCGSGAEFCDCKGCKNFKK